jgi:hypothetical protein
MTTYEIHKNKNERTRQSSTGRIYTTNRPFWCVVVDGEWDGSEYATKREAEEFVEWHKGRPAHD